MLRQIMALPLILAFLAADKPVRYAKPEFLIEAADVARLAKLLTILDARPQEKYASGHIPGAVWLDVARWEKAFAAGQDVVTWKPLLGALGIEEDRLIVVVDDNLSKDASRVWWILRYWGCRDVRILNGGWKAWLEASLPTDRTEKVVKATSPVLEAQIERLALKQTVLDNLKRMQIVDARSENEHCGLKETAKRNGSIPGAKQLEWSDLLDRKTGRFKTAPEMHLLFEQAGIDPARPTITYCQSGGRASVMAFCLELLGGKASRNYYGSWSEWGNAEDTPVVKPTKK